MKNEPEINFRARFFIYQVGDINVVRFFQRNACR